MCVSVCKYVALASSLILCVFQRVALKIDLILSVVCVFQRVACVAGRVAVCCNVLQCVAMCRRV